MNNSNLDNTTTLSDAIRHYREAAGLSRVELARLIGASHKTVWNWEAKGNAPHSDILQRLIEALVTHGVPEAEELSSILSRMKESQKYAEESQGTISDSPIAAAIQRTRRAANLSQHALAQCLSTHVRHLQSWEMGKQVPTQGMLKKLVNTLSPITSVDELLPFIKSQGDVPPIAAAITHARESIGLSIGDLAKLIRVKPYTVWRWEAGKQPPNPETVKKIADILKAPDLIQTDKEALIKDSNIQLGDAIKRAREAAGLTQLELAQRAGVTLQNVEKWEHGKRMPQQMGQICEILGAPELKEMAKTLRQSRLRINGYGDITLPLTADASERNQSEKGKTEQGPEIDDNTPAAILERVRLTKKLTIEQFASFAGVTTKTVKNWQKGIVVPNQATLLRLAKALNSPDIFSLLETIASKAYQDCLRVKISTSHSNGQRLGNRRTRV